jgi:hypothetical protein
MPQTKLTALSFLALLAVLGCAPEHGDEEAPLLSPNGYVPFVAQGVRCGASFSDLIANRKDAIVLVEQNPRLKEKVFAESVEGDPLFQRVSYTIRGARVVAIAAYSGKTGIYHSVIAGVEELLGKPTSATIYPDPMKTAWIMGPTEIAVSEEDREVVLRTSCPLEAGR